MTLRLLNTLKLHRVQANLTQAQLAEQVSVSRKSINSIENGHYVPSTELALKLARALDTQVEQIFQLP